MCVCVYDQGQPDFALSPTTGATAFINNLAQQIAALASVALVAQTQAAAASDPAAPLNGRKRPCARPKEEADKVLPETAPSPMETEGGDGTNLEVDPGKKDDPAATQVKDPA